MRDTQQSINETADKQVRTLEVVIVGAGFAGMYMLHRLRELGVSTRVYETGSGVGGTWFGIVTLALDVM